MMDAVCKMTGEATTWPCSAPGCPLYGDCLSEYAGSTKPMTNADRIRAMSDEELAVASVRYEGTVVNATRYGGHEHKFYGPHGEPCANKEQAILMWFNWLQSPAEEDT